jgi:fumarate reductase flavoprotein subunit
MAGIETCDVVVLGGGLAGHCAALAATDSGASVVLLEKRAEHGGSTALSGGSFAFAGTDLQRSQGIEDSSDILAADLRRVGADRNDPALVRLYAEQQLETYGWLRGLGVPFDRVTLSGNQSRPRTHATDPAALMRRLHEELRARPHIRYRPSTAAERLLARDGRVSGVRLADGGEVLADDGVVLATGGFSRSVEALRSFAPQLSGALMLGGEGNHGDGLRMAMAVGAGLADMGEVTGTFGIAQPVPETGSPLLMAIYRGAIVVNREGRRFADESKSYKVIGGLCLQQPGRMGFQIFDARVMATSATSPVVNDFQGALRRGTLQEGATPEALAAKLGIDPASLAGAIVRYNADIERGQDTEFGRGSLGGGFGTPFPLREPPFYGYACTTAVISTYAGIHVDTAMRVIDVFGVPIPGLFGAGEVIGGVHGAGYMSGSALGKAAIFGRIAGRAAARANATPHLETLA